MIMFFLCLFVIFINVFYFMSIMSFIGILLGMEFMGVSVMVYVFFSLDFHGFILYFLVISVCEGAIGLTMLVYFLSYYGLDYVDFSSLAS